jgi:hypothetical protein
VQHEELNMKDFTDQAGESHSPRKKDSPLRVWDVAPFSLPCVIEAALLVIVICFILGLLLRTILSYWS